MKEKLLLVGSGGFGRVVLEHASQYFDCAFLDDGNLKIVDGAPVIGTTVLTSPLVPVTVNRAVNGCGRKMVPVTVNTVRVKSNNRHSAK